MPERASDTERVDDAERLFRTDHLDDDLKGRSVRGGAATMAGQAGTFALNTVALVVLARLLTPTDFGLIAMVAAVTNFVSMFKDMGLSMATIQRADVTHAQVNTLFWINVALSAGVTVVVAALAPGLAWFYDEPRLVAITVALAGAIFVSGLSVQHAALLKRQMRFGSLAVLEVTAIASGIAVAIAAAWQGAGYWALVFQQLTQAAVRTSATWLACRWRPGRPAWERTAGSMLAFGGHLTGFSLVNYFARNADDVLIGRYVGAGALGLYDKAYKLLLAPIELIRKPISNVVIPSLSRLQDDPARYRSYAMKALSVIVFLSMPLVTFCFAEADRIVELVLGAQWSESAHIFRVLAVVALIQSFNMVTGWSYISLDQTDRWLRWGIFYGLFVVTGFVIGLQWGAFGVAVSYVITNYLILIPSFLYCFRTSHLRTKDIFITVWKPALFAIVAAAAVLIWNAEIELATFLVLQLAASALLFGGVYLACWLALPTGRRHVGRLLSLVRELRTP